MSAISDRLIEAAQRPLSPDNPKPLHLERAFCLVLGMFFEQQERIKELEALYANSILARDGESGTEPSSDHHV